MHTYENIWDAMSFKIDELIDWAGDLCDAQVYPDNVWENYRTLLDSIRDARENYDTAS
jgi:hypothetical protein